MTLVSESMTGHPIVDAISRMHFEGDITPKSWYQHIRYTNKRGTYPDPIAIDLLSDIVYWYRASETRDEKTGHLTGWKKKFKYESLQRSPEHFSKLFGYSVKQVRESLKLLADLDLIAIELKPVKTQFGTVPNVMHISLNPARLADITYRVTAETIEKSLLTNSETSDAEMGRKRCRNRKQLMPKSETTDAEMGTGDGEIGKSSLYRDLEETTEETEGEISATSPLTPQGEQVVFEQPSPIKNSPALEEENQPQTQTVEPKPLSESSANLSQKKITTARWRETGKLGKHGYPNVVNMQGIIVEMLPWIELNDTLRSGYGFNPEFEAFVSKQQVNKNYFAEMQPGEFVAAIKDWIGRAATDEERFGQVMRRWEMFERNLTDEGTKTVKELYQESEREKRWQAIAQNQPMPTEPQPAKPERKKLTIKDAM